MIGFLLFLIAITIYFQIINNLSSDSENEINEMVLDLKTISNSLISEGYPTNWNTSNVQRIGLTNKNYRLNQTKLTDFASMNYSKIKNVFDTRFNFYFFIKDQEGNMVKIDGNDGIGMESNNTQIIIQLSRIVIYNSSIVNMVMQLW